MEKGERGQGGNEEESGDRREDEIELESQVIEKSLP